MSKLTSMAVSVLGAAGLIAASAALAQDPAPASAQGQAYGHGDPARREARMQAHRQERAQALQAALQLRPDQDAAFQAFEQATTPSRNLDWRRDQDADQTTMTTPQRLDMMLSRMDQRMATARRRVAATKQFYAALSPQQQRAFDGLMQLRSHDRGGGGPHMHRAGWGGFPGAM